jgi:hypothetical protein
MSTQYLPSFTDTQLAGAAPNTRALDEGPDFKDALETHIANGEASLRDRDAYHPALASAKQSVRPASREVNPNPYTLWPNTSKTGFKTISFEPNGSFKSIRDAGKLGAPNERGISGGAAPYYQQKKHYIPHYTGFVRGLQHVAGRTYGEATRRALDTDYRENVCTSPIPSAPQNNMKINHIQPPNTFVSNTFAGKQYHVPGYTGFVPGVRQTYARTFGTATSQEMYTNSLQHPRQHPREAEGKAHSMKPRSFLVVDSAPLPGATRPQAAPDKLIPSHLQHLKFFPH